MRRIPVDLSRSLAVAVFAAALALSGATQAARADELPAAEQRVERDSPSGKGGYTLTESLALGGGGAPEAAQFYERMGQIEVDADAQGNIYVLDNGNHRVQVFDPSGKLLHSIGSEGSGPGEFKMPARLSVSADGTSAVFDMGQQRISFFAPDGKLLRDQIIAGMVKDMAMTKDGGLVVAYGMGSGSDLEEFDAKGNSAWTVARGEQPSGGRFVSIEMDRMTVGSRLNALPNGVILQASPDEYWIRRVDPGGKPALLMTRPYDRQKMPELQKMSDLKRKGGDKGGEGGAVMIVRREGGAGGQGTVTSQSGGSGEQHVTLNMDDVSKMMPKNSPDIRALLVWPDGRVWVVTSQDEGQNMLVDEWTPDGQYSKRFAIPQRYVRLQIGADGKLYGVGHDADDFPVVYRLSVSAS